MSQLSDNLISMKEITATEAARNFAEILDAVQNRGESFTITRHGKVVANLEPAREANGESANKFFAQASPDLDWLQSILDTRALLTLDR